MSKSELVVPECDAACECCRTDFVLDHKAIAAYAVERFGPEAAKITVVRRPQVLDERTQMWSVAYDCVGWMRYRFHRDDDTIASIRITLVSRMPNPDDPHGPPLYRTARETLQTLAHEFEHIQQLYHHGPSALQAAYRRERGVFEKHAIEAEKKWAELGHLLKVRKRGAAQ